MFYDIWGTQDSKFLKKLDLEKWNLNTAVIYPKKVNELKILVKKNKNADFLLLNRPNEKIQKVAIQRCEVDGINAFVKYPFIKEMARKNIALIVSFNSLLNSTNLEKTLGLMRRTIKLAKKYKTPIVIVSGSQNKWEMRSSSELIAFGEILGLNKGQAKKALSNFQQKIIKRQKLKKSGKYIRPGVEIK